MTEDLEQPKKKRGRPADPKKVPAPSELARQMMAEKAIYRILVRSLLLNPDKMDAVPLAMLVKEVARGSEQSNEPGKLVLAIPDAMAKNLRGDSRLMDLYLLVRVPRELSDAMLLHDDETDDQTGDETNG